MPSIESMVVRVVVDVSDQLSARLAGKEELPPAAATNAATTDLFADLGRSDVEALESYLGSPDFATVVVQKRVGNMMGKAAKDQLREGLRLAGLSDHPLTRITDILHDVMVVACQEVAPHFGGAGAKIHRADLYAAAMHNSILLKRLKSSARIHVFAARMRDQVAALHNKIRMPHSGVSRSVRYDQLYVKPTLASSFVIRLGVPGERVLVQGDPGAGKSTLAAKFAHDIAVDDAGRVPFLLVLREFATSFDEGGRDLLHYLEKLCQAPYNVKPPRDAVEYLLRTGRAVVIIDGLDELVQTQLRRRVVSLLEGFAHLYPLVPILVTARKIGYEDAPLSTDLFLTGRIAEFDEQQVAGYVSRWFALDEATSPAERERLAKSFMEDSRQIPELRSNPLLLTLLCAMYSSDRYLPHNLAQVYERCALMMFEQWDSKRGIDLPLSFEGRLRGAVQHLAWKMFTAPDSSKTLSRVRIVRMLTEYLEVKIDDYDESIAMARQFLEYCTGRSWILTDVGAERYGFTHRTFLEYFAAEHLVRTHRSAASLWTALEPNIDQWDVVAQIALQLYDRQVEDGVDELLMEALGGGLGFASRSLRHVHPANRTIRAIATAAVDAAVFVPAEARFDSEQLAVETDTPLLICMNECSQANHLVVKQTLRNRLDELVRQGELGAALVLDGLFFSEGGELWRAMRWELISQHRERLLEIRKTAPWAGGFAMEEPGFLLASVERHGMRALYTTCVVHYTRQASAAQKLLRGIGPVFVEAEFDAIAAAAIGQPSPWLASRPFKPKLQTLSAAGDLRLVLSLPFLEAVGSRDRAVSWLDRNHITPAVREFVTRWAHGEINVLAPGR
ncbi:NACHT domain-containing protein [Lentzea sp. NBC_00516]|uniref:NACHT domain-containing protein n=1 Tax=Lentzea sp. NBC_00516 TaxID=2903582 RepID=UPI002E80A5A7|nr:NACHT domain-containing protein [Lentzea sp. NBC_00516]WUD21022.1 NACHT domain-containing protein [Lentzea sp. NBC_00516]